MVPRPNPGETAPWSIRPAGRFRLISPALREAMVVIPEICSRALLLNVLFLRRTFQPLASRCRPPTLRRACLQSHDGAEARAREDVRARARQRGHRLAEVHSHDLAAERSLPQVALEGRLRAADRCARSCPYFSGFLRFFFFSCSFSLHSKAKAI